LSELKQVPGAPFSKSLHLGHVGQQLRMEYHNGLRSKAIEEDEDFDWDPAQAEIDHEEALLVEEKAARRVSKSALHRSPILSTVVLYCSQCIRTFNFCSLAPAAGLLGFSIWAEQFAFGSTAQFLVWALASVGAALFFLTLLGCVGSIKGATSILLIVRSMALDDFASCIIALFTVLHWVGLLRASLVDFGWLLFHLLGLHSRPCS